MNVRVLNCSCFVQIALAQVREKEADKLQDVDWHGHAVPVRNESVRVFLVHVQDSRHELERATTYEERMQVFDDLLLDCQQAMQSLSDDIKADTSVGLQGMVMVLVGYC